MNKSGNSIPAKTVQKHNNEISGLSADKTLVLFVNPPSPDGSIYIRDIDRSGRYTRENTIWPQANLAYLAAVMSDAYEVDLIDCIAERIDWSDFEEYIRAGKPRFIVTNVISSILSNDLKVADIGQAIGARTIAIGPHVTALPEETLREYPNLDFVIMGEAEASLRELVDLVKDDRSLDGVKGIGFRYEDGTVKVNEARPEIENLDDLPNPRHDLLPLDKYQLPFIGKRYTFVMTSRGCPYNCTFCRSPVMWGRKFRQRSPDSIIGELKELKKLGVNSIIFHSDTFTLDKKWLLEFCQKMVQENLGIRWLTNSRADTVDEEMLHWMKRAGCWMIAYGFESGSQEVLDNVKKGITIQQIKGAARWTKDAGIKSWGYFIIGLPGETKETIEATIKLSKELPLYNANFAVGAPYPGTDFYKLVSENGWLLSDSWEDFDQNYSAIVSYDTLSSDEIIAGIRKAYRAWYLRPKQLLKFAFALRSFKDVKDLVDTGIKHIRMMYGRAR